MLTAPARYQNHASHSAIIERAAAATGYDAEAILRACRWPVMCEIRYAIMLVLRGRGLTHEGIAALLNRDVSTVTTGLQRAEKLHAAGGDFARLCEVIS